MSKTYYHGGRESNWVAEDESYAAGYAAMNGGGMTAVTIEVEDDDVLDLTECGYDAEQAAEILTEAGFTSRGGEDEDTHCVVNRLDLAAVAAQFKAIRIREWTDGVGETTSMLILDLAIITSKKELV